MAFARFHPVVRQWFTSEVGEPTPAQLRGWEAIADGPAHAHRRADRIGQDARGVPHRDRRAARGRPHGAAARRGARRLRLAAEGAQRRHPQEPRRAARRHSQRWPKRPGSHAPTITAAVRTGDTTQSERAAMLRTPPHILVTTPESLYLLLTAERSRQMLRTVRTVIVDEIHAVIGTRRGAHLALSLERLAAGRRAAAAAASGCRRRRSRSRRSRGSSTGRRRRRAAPSSTRGTGATMDLGVEMPRSPLDAVMSHEVWEEYYDRLAALIAAAPDDAGLREHAADGGAARAPPERSARRGGGHRASRQPLEREAARRRDAAEGRTAEGARRDGVAGARHRHRPRRSRLPDRIAASDRDAAAAGRAVGAHRRRHCRRAACSRSRATTWSSARRCCAPSGRGELDAIVSHDAPLDVLAQQIVAESACRDYARGRAVRAGARARGRIARSTRIDFDAVCR